MAVVVYGGSVVSNTISRYKHCSFLRIFVAIAILFVQGVYIKYSEEVSRRDQKSLINIKRQKHDKRNTTSGHGQTQFSNIRNRKQKQ
jgi:hypothetical protein